MRIYCFLMSREQYAIKIRFNHYKQQVKEGKHPDRSNWDQGSNFSTIGGSIQDFADSLEIKTHIREVMQPY